MRKERFIRLILAWGLFFVFTDLSFALDYFEFNNKVNKIPPACSQDLSFSPRKIKPNLDDIDVGDRPDLPEDRDDREVYDIGFSPEERYFLPGLLPSNVSIMPAEPDKKEDPNGSSIKEDSDFWWKGKSLEEMLLYLVGLDPKEAAERFSELIKEDLELAVKMLEKIYKDKDFYLEYHFIISDIAGIIANMDVELVVELFEETDVAVIGKILCTLDEFGQNYIISAEKAAEIISLLSPDKAAQLLLDFFTDCKDYASGSALWGFKPSMRRDRLTEILGEMSSCQVALILNSEELDAYECIRILCHAFFGNDVVPNKDKAKEILDSLEEINPEKAKEIRKVMII